MNTSESLHAYKYIHNDLSIYYCKHCFTINDSTLCEQKFAREK